MTAPKPELAAVDPLVERIANDDEHADFWRWLETVLLTGEDPDKAQPKASQDAAQQTTQEKAAAAPDSR